LQDRAAQPCGARDLQQRSTPQTTPGLIALAAIESAINWIYNRRLFVFGFPASP
jgi:hypothetical protein